MYLRMNFTERLDAARTLVFDEVTDFENLQVKYPDLFISLRVLERSNELVLTHERFSVLGSTFSHKSRHTLKRPTTHTVEILTGDLRGSKVVEHYAVGRKGGTIVKVEAEFSLGGVLSLLPRFIVKPMVEGNLKRVFEELEGRLSKG